MKKCSNSQSTEREGSTECPWQHKEGDASVGTRAHLRVLTARGFVHTVVGDSVGGVHRPILPVFSRQQREKGWEGGDDNNNVVE